MGSLESQILDDASLYCQRWIWGDYCYEMRRQFSIMILYAYLIMWVPLKVASFLGNGNPPPLHICVPLLLQIPTAGEK